MNRKIVLNQLGYINNMPKSAVIVGAAESFQIVDIKHGRTMFSGIADKSVYDISSNDTVYRIDFSGFNASGHYYIRSGRKKSPIFAIEPDPYGELKKALLKGLYYNRCGISLRPRYAGEFTHEKCHDEFVPIFESPSHKLDVSGGWHVSGGYGKFSVCTCIAIGHLLYAYKFFPDSFSEEICIPESGNGLPDILNECRVGLEWLLKMQARDGGVYHKVSSVRKTPVIMPENDHTERYVFPRSHQATACFCAVMSLSSRVFGAFDEKFSERLHEASINAWIWLMNNPLTKPFENPPTVAFNAAGDFYDANLDDDIFWAVCELYETTGDEVFHNKIRELSSKINLIEFRNRDNGGFGAMSYLFGTRSRDDTVEQLIRLQLRIKADNLYSLCQKNGYNTAKAPGDYILGSNMYAMTDAMILIFAYKIFDCKDYLDAAYEQLNYILGKNPLGICYVTGFGSERTEHPHHRPSEADDIEDPVPGLLVCGPNKNLQDDFSNWNIPSETAPAKCYYDIMYSYTTNEATIFTNSAAVFVTACFSRAKK